MVLTPFPANFPSTWVGQTGAGSFTTASGSITVIGSAAAQLTSSWNGTTLTLTWPAGWTLLESTNLVNWTTNLSAQSPFPVTPSAPKQFFKLIG